MGNLGHQHQSEGQQLEVLNSQLYSTNGVMRGHEGYIQVQSMQKAALF